MSETTSSDAWEQARSITAAWLSQERDYVHSKWGESKHETEILQTGIKGAINRDVGMYVHRAHILGLENPLGRQALMKGLSTFHSYVEAMIRMFGPPPQGGVPSGEDVDWIVHGDSDVR